MNKIVLIGNLTHDPDTRSTPNGVTVCSFTIAVNRRFASQGGEKQTDFFRINFSSEFFHCGTENVCHG